MQSSPMAHARPQRPQCAGSLRTSTQPSPQKVAPTGQRIGTSTSGTTVASRPSPDVSDATPSRARSDPASNGASPRDSLQAKRVDTTRATQQQRSIARSGHPSTGARQRHTNRHPWATEPSLLRPPKLVVEVHGCKAIANYDAPRCERSSAEDRQEEAATPLRTQRTRGVSWAQTLAFQPYPICWLMRKRVPSPTMPSTV